MLCLYAPHIATHIAIDILAIPACLISNEHTVESTLYCPDMHGYTMP